MAANLCPACLSSVDADAAYCAQCGADLGKPRRRPTAVVVTAVLVAGAGGLGLWILSRDKPAETATAMVAPAPTEPAAAPPAVAPPSPHHLWLVGDQPGSQRFPAVVLRAATPDDAPVALFVALGNLPVRGGLLDADGEPFAVTVVNYSLELGYALLAPARLPPGLDALPAGALGALAVGDEVIVRPASGGTASGWLEAFDGPAGARLDRKAPPGAAIVAGDTVRAVVLLGTEILPLDRTLEWLPNAGTRALEVVQEELRTWMPEHLLAEIESLTEPPAHPDDLVRALQLLERVRARLHVPAELDALAERERGMHTNLVRVLAKTDRPAALRRARLAVAKFPNAAPLLADAVMLALDENPHEAIALLGQLRAISAVEAARIAESVREGLDRRATRLIEAGSLQEGLGLYRAATEQFPGHAHLHAGRAQGLALAQRLGDAAAEAALAAQLDPNYSALATRYGQLAAEAAEPGRSNAVEIPVDPLSRSIRARVEVSGISVEYIVDTGATLTTIPSQVSINLGLVSLGRARVETAGAIVHAEIVEIPELTIGSIVVKRVRALVMDLPGNLGGKGLLGLNVLKKLNMRLEAGGSKLVLQASGGNGR